MRREQLFRWCYPAYRDERLWRGSTLPRDCYGRRCNDLEGRAGISASRPSPVFAVWTAPRAPQSDTGRRSNFQSWAYSCLLKYSYSTPLPARLRHTTTRPSLTVSAGVNKTLVLFGVLLGGV